MWAYHSPYLNMNTHKYNLIIYMYIEGQNILLQHKGLTAYPNVIIEYHTNNSKITENNSIKVTCVQFHTH